MVCEHKNGSHYREDRPKCGRQKGLIDYSRLVQRRKESIDSVHLVCLGETLGHHHAVPGGDQLQICCFSVTSSDFKDTGVAGSLLMAHDTA